MCILKDNNKELKTEIKKKGDAIRISINKN